MTVETMTLAGAKRHEKAADLLRMALWAGAAADGVTIDEVMSTFGVSRRTAERMRDVLADLFQLREMDSDDRRKRWRIEAGPLARLVDVDADVLADLETASRLLEEKNNDDAAGRIRHLSAGLQARLSHQKRNRLAPDVEALAEAEGFALRPGPKEACDAGVMETLRQALLSRCYVKVDHRSKISGKLSRGQKLGVLGFLYGPHRRYLVAWSDYAKSQRLYALSGFERAELSKEPFIEAEDFELKDYIANAFGVFQEEPVKVVWRFAAAVANEAEKFVFHASQTITREEDGSLIVEFTAGGKEEMCWHLFTWGPHVEVVEPSSLRNRYQDQLKAILAMQTALRSANLQDGGFTDE